MEIKINVIGEILSGDDQGKYIKIVDDTDATGGYLILILNDVIKQNGYDYWVESMVALKKFFVESGWTINWLNYEK